VIDDKSGDPIFTVKIMISQLTQIPLVIDDKSGDPIFTVKIMISQLTQIPPRD
jgi:hypothetical protein